MYVYRFTNNFNSMKYIGATIDIEKRRREHIRIAERKKFSKNSLQEAIYKYGVSSFFFDVIDEAESLEELSDKEAEWIDKEGCIYPNGYNLNAGHYAKKPRLIEEITVAGVTYPSISEAHRVLQPKAAFDGVGGKNDDGVIQVKTVTERIAGGWTVEQAFGVDEPPKYRENITYMNNVGDVWVVDEEEYLSLAHAYDTINPDINFYTIKARIQRGWSNEEAFGLARRNVRSKRCKPICIDGKMFGSEKDASDFYGVNEGTFKGRLRIGWTPEQAAGIEEAPKKVWKTIRGIDFNNLAQAARYFGVEPTCVHSRLHRGLPLEQALGLEPFEQKKYNNPRCKPVTVFGKTFRSRAKAAEFYAKEKGLNVNTILGRVFRGWSLEDAVSMDKMCNTESYKEALCKTNVSQPQT